MNYAEMLTVSICDYTTHAAHWYIGVVEYTDDETFGTTVETTF